MRVSLAFSLPLRCVTRVDVALRRVGVGGGQREAQSETESKREGEREGYIERGCQSERENADMRNDSSMCIHTCINIYMDEEMRKYVCIHVYIHV